ncbi:hypothetical protein [Nocardia asteroides]|uniref:hypothetical protein n=1 Tax=Nocardia asteroides TaxID=1824 RepID=UPI0033C57E58
MHAMQEMFGSVDPGRAPGAHDETHRVGADAALAEVVAFAHADLGGGRDLFRVAVYRQHPTELVGDRHDQTGACRVLDQQFVDQWHQRGDGMSIPVTHQIGTAKTATVEGVRRIDPATHTA